MLNYLYLLMLIIMSTISRVLNKKFSSFLYENDTSNLILFPYNLSSVIKNVTNITLLTNPTYMLDLIIHQNKLIFWFLFFEFSLISILLDCINLFRKAFENNLILCLLSLSPKFIVKKIQVVCYLISKIISNLYQFIL